jgi:hypothetical protein
MPSRASFEPRAFLKYPEDFGKRIDPVWLPRPEGHPELGQFIAAHFQCVASFLMADRMRDKGLTVEEVAAAFNTSADTLQRKMRGEVPAKLQDLVLPRGSSSRIGHTTRGSAA